MDSPEIESMARPFFTGLVLLLAAAASRAEAQSLGEAARRAEQGRKNPSTSTLVFDGRDLDPSVAEQELLDFAITEARWQRYLVADRQVGAALSRDQALLGRLKGLQATSVLGLERFLKREPALAAALTSAGADAHEFAFTQLSVGTVLSLQSQPGRRALEDAPEQVAANAAFLKGRASEVQALAVPRDVLVLRIAAMASAPAVSRVDPEPSAAPAAPLPPPPAPGVPVPDFTFVDFNGGARRLSDYRGRYVLLDFWGLWCPNCRAEIPFLKDAYAQFQSRGLEIIGMDYEKGASFDTVRQYLAENNVTWTFARADSVRDVIKNQFQIDGFPTLILVDPSGGLINASSGSLRGARLARTLDKLLPK
jgi:thiol-disulfide isomerase/thioredoxin